MQAMQPRSAEQRAFRRRLLPGLAGLLALATLFTVAAATPVTAMRARLADELASVRTEYAAAQGELARADAELETAREALSVVANLVSPLVDLEGEPITPEARAALTAARDAALGFIAKPETPASASLDVPEPERLPLAELVDWRDRLGDAARELGQLARDREELAASVDGEGAALGTALGEYLTAVTSRGVALLAEHEDTSEARLALQSAIDALPDAETEDLPEVLRAAVRAAAAL